MSSEWLTAESFERNQRLLSAINTISIYTKLALDHTPDAPDVGDVPAARGEITEFLKKIGPLIQATEKDRGKTALGTDERMSLLVQQFATSRQRRPSSILHTLPIENVPVLLESSRPADQQQLINYLRALRALVEQHVHADVVTLLGEL